MHVCIYVWINKLENLINVITWLVASSHCGHCIDMQIHSIYAQTNETMNYTISLTVSKYILVKLQVFIFRTWLSSITLKIFLFYFVAFSTWIVYVCLCIYIYIYIYIYIFPFSCTHTPKPNQGAFVTHVVVHYEQGGITWLTHKLTKTKSVPENSFHIQNINVIQNIENTFLLYFVALSNWIVCVHLFIYTHFTFSCTLYHNLHKECL